MELISVFSTITFSILFRNLLKLKCSGMCNRLSDLETLNTLLEKLISSIAQSKQRSYAKIASKLFNPNISAKFYWSLLESSWAGKSVPCIPPIFHQDKFITDFKQKIKLFNSIFANQCFLINHHSKKWLILIYLEIILCPITIVFTETEPNWSSWTWHYKNLDEKTLWKFNLHTLSPYLLILIRSRRIPWCLEKSK